MSTSLKNSARKVGNTKYRRVGEVFLSKEVQETQKAARQASSTAIRISRALDLPVQFIEKGKLVEVQGAGKKKVIKTIQPIESKISLKKGDKICLKPRG